MIEYGLQLYSLRDITKDDMKEALRRVAEMGYKYVEFAGFFGHPAEDVKAWLDEFGLKASATHTSYAELMPYNIKKTVEYHKAIGCNTVIVPGTVYNTPEELELSVALFNYAEKYLKNEGLSFGYHNHSGEFYPTPYGKVVEDEIINRTDAMLEIDVFWLFNAGIDPVTYLEAHKDRISVIHLKDGDIPVGEVRDFKTAHNGVVGKSLGLGMAPIAQVREWALKNNVLMVVESEGLEPTGSEEVKRCIDYLRSLETN